MELLTDGQVADLITVYENKIRGIKEKIRDELQERRDLKAKIEEAKQREATQIQILDRLDEYDKVVDKQLELAERMEDNESLQQLKIIEKYESMLSEQQKVWAKYEEEYERLPLARDRQKAEVRLLNAMIKNKLMYHKMQDTKRMIKMKNQIDEQREKMKIVEFAKRFVQHEKRRKNCQELVQKIQDLKLKERQLLFEIGDLEKKAEKEKVGVETRKLLMKPQQLPQVDLSRFIIHRDKNNDNYDTVSMNSYVLEQEYMNNDESMNDKVESKTSQQKTTEKESQENLTDSEPMDVDDNSNCNGNDEHMRNKKSNSQQSSHSVKEQEPQQQNHSNRANQMRMSEKTKDRNDRKHDSENQANKKSSQENQSGFDQQAEGKNTHKKRANQIYVEKEEAPRAFTKNAGNHQSAQLAPNACKKIQNERPIPSPVKMQKRSSQEQQPQQSSPNQSKSMNNSMDSSRVPQGNKKPIIKSNEFVNFPNIQIQQLQNQRGEGQSNVHTPQVFSSETPLSMLPTSSMARSAQQQQQQQRQQATSFSQQNSFAMDFQYDSDAISTTSIAANTMLMDPTLHSADMNMFNISGDNVSAILGSEITDPGGSFEFARRIYGDPDVNSEDGDFGYGKFIENLCSPLAPNANNQNQQNVFENRNNQPQMMLNNNPPKPNSQENENKFNFGNFGKKQTQTAQRFF